MNAITFDTLKFVERLKLGGVSDEQAKAEVEALGDALKETLVVREFSTKQDLIEESALLRHDILEMELRLITKIGDIKYDMVKWMAGMMIAQVAVISALVKLL